MKPASAPTCPWEDRILQAFLEGMPGADAGVVAAHLEECPECRRALDSSRVLDATLAAQARTELSEEQADRLLAFLGRPAPARPKRRRRLALRLLPALAGVLGLAMVLPGRRETEEPAAPETVVAQAEETPPPARPTPLGLLAGRFLTVPDSFRLPPRIQAPPPGPERFLAAFQGKPDQALNEARLAAKAREILAAADPMASGPLPMAAAGWLLERVQAGALPLSRAFEPARLLLRAEGEARLAMAGLFRRRPELLLRLARLPFGQEPELVPLHGAVGNQAALAALATAGEEFQEAAVRAAWRTGDGHAARFVLALFLEAALRSTARERSGAEWVLAMPGPMAELLLPELDRRARGAPGFPERALCRRLLGALSEEFPVRGS